MQEMLNFSAQRFDQMPCTIERKADQIDHYIGLQIRNLLAEASRLFDSVSIDSDSFNGSPSGMRLVRFAFTAADGYDLVPSSH
jgi:hypothetical protein